MKMLSRDSTVHCLRRRGLITVMVVVMFVFIAAAVVSLTLLFATELRRTRSAVVGAQLRELLLAGVPAATEELTVHGTAARDVAIPTPVAGAAVFAHITPIAADKVSIRIIAKLPNGAAAQSVSYVRRGGRWQIASAILEAQP